MPFKPRTACRRMWGVIKSNECRGKPPLTPSYKPGEAPFYRFSVYDKRGRPQMFLLNIDDFVAELPESEQAAARKYFGIADKQWNRWEDRCQAQSMKAFFFP